MNTLTVKLKNGEFFQFEDFKDFSIDENNTLLTVVCKEKLCNYFSVDCVSYIVQSESVPEEKSTLTSDGKRMTFKDKRNRKCMSCLQRQRFSDWKFL